MESLFKFKYYENGYAELSEKVNFSKKYLWKGSSCEKVAVQNKRASKKYILWIITYSGEKAPPKQ